MGKIGVFNYHISNQCKLKHEISQLPQQPWGHPGLHRDALRNSTAQCVIIIFSLKTRVGIALPPHCRRFLFSLSASLTGGGRVSSIESPSPPPPLLSHWWKESHFNSPLRHLRHSRARNRRFVRPLQPQARRPRHQIPQRRDPAGPL